MRYYFLKNYNLVLYYTVGNRDVSYYNILSMFVDHFCDITVFNRIMIIFFGNLYNFLKYIRYCQFLFKRRYYPTP